MIEKDHLGDWSPDNSPSQDSNHPDDLFQSRLKLKLFGGRSLFKIIQSTHLPVKKENYIN